ncbi:DsbA family protein [Marinomonas pollencensis]|uniref:DSBA-like thioredoxin domain-containing protein n=1 Tax=Marinomonas pollencensis TaxID=491954 RepID=A0A3E0DSL2_9GAMM|nr:DsbA family protein [Marinomonas pollencensis]REG86539.1 putative protein-disulfide isomerase [Marinomonas pollencensis]
MEKDIIYVGDPMCSWCFGFSEVKHKLIQQCKGRANIRFIAGGLYPDRTDKPDEKYRHFLQEHWVKIGKLTGQRFALEILSREDLMYNTELPCRAVVSVREMEGDEVALDFFTHLQKAFYSEGVCISNDAALIELARCFGLDKERFSALYFSDAMKQQTRADFAFSQRLGVTGFPTVVVKDRAGYAYLTVGYQPYEQLQALLEAWLSDQLPEQHSGDVPEPVESCIFQQSER